MASVGGQWWGLGLIMGKLHTLKRAIMREPEKWRKARGAYFTDNKWYPNDWAYWGRKAYGGYIKKILNAVGLADSEPGR